MGMFFDNDKETYCGSYKGIGVYQYGSMIGNNWYGEFYCRVPRGKTKRNMKVDCGGCWSLEAINEYIDKNLLALYKMGGYYDKAIKYILKERGTDKFHLEYLVDLGDEEDFEGEVFAITCDTIILKDKNIFIGNSNNENEEGIIDEEELYPFNRLTESQRKEVLWALTKTIEWLDK